jgi:spoIIIJ-associated protein
VTDDESVFEDGPEDGGERDIDAELPEDPGERIRAALERIAEGFSPDAHVEVEETEDEIRATIEGGDEEMGLLIGKHGSTIDAIQHLAARIGYRGLADRKAVVVDAAGYRARREGALQRAADQAVSDALAYGRPVELEPMSSPERRIVHTYLRDRAEVQTHSEGDEPERRLVVSPVRST